MHTHAQIYFKQLIYMIVQPGKSEICRAGWQGGNSQAGTDVAVTRQNFFFTGKPRCCSQGLQMIG